MGVDSTIDPRDAAAIAAPTPAPTRTPLPTMTSGPSGIAGPLTSAWRIGRQAGTWAEKGYEQDVYPYAKTAVGYAAGNPYRSLMHPIQTAADLTKPAAYEGSSWKQAVSPQAAQEAGYELTPATIPQATRDVVSLAMPGSRLQRLGTMLGASALTGALTGQDPVRGGIVEGAKGVGQMLPFELLGYAGSKGAGALATAGEKKVGTEAMEDFGAALNRRFPFLGPLKTSEDFVDHFVGGDNSLAIRQASASLNATKREVGSDVGNYRFIIRRPTTEEDLLKLNRNLVNQPTPTEPTVDELMRFPEADEALTDLNRFGYVRKSGTPRAGFNAEAYRDLSHRNRDLMVYQMNQIRPKVGDIPGAGNRYMRSRKDFDATNTLTNMFKNNPQELFEQGVIQQRPMMARLDKHAEDLKRSLSDEEFSGLRRALRHGEPQEKYDVPSVKGQVHARMHIPLPIPHGAPLSAVKIPGHSFEPVGQVPLWMKLGKPIEQGQRILQPLAGHEWFGPGNNPATPGPISSAAGLISGEGSAYAAESPQDLKPRAMPEIEQLQHRELAPTPSGATRAAEISRSLERRRAPEDVTQDLNRGHLSSDEMKRLLQHSSSTDPATRVAGIPLADLIGAVEIGTPEEKRVLVPLIQTRMVKELPKIANKTMQARLAQRFRMLAQSVKPRPIPAPVQ